MTRRYYELSQQDKAAHPETWYIDEFRERFFDAVKLRLRSDVPVGYALSGGVDSSSIVVAAHHINHGGDNATFSTTYPGSGVDESAYISAVIEKTGFRQYSISPSAEQLAKEMDAFVWHQEEPVSSLSYYAEFCLRRLIREKEVIVSLEGQGADEIISGYTTLISPYLQDLMIGGRWQDFHKEYLRFKDAARITPLVLFADILSVAAPRIQVLLRKRYKRSVSGELNHDFLAQFGSPKRPENHEPAFGSRLNQMLYHYLTFSYVPPQLVRADKSSMAFSVECRFPFLDYRLVELAFSVPGNLKIRDGVTKFILREAIKEYLPDKIYNRRDKLGFPAPQESWLRNELKGLMDEVVNSRGFKELPFINFNEFRRKYDEFKRSGGSFNDQLWKLAGVYIWMKRFNITA